MAFTQKSSSVIQRDEGEFPQLPDQAEARMKGWWSDTVAVLDRVRDKIGEIESTTGAKGEKGDKGDKGDTGNAGAAGTSATAEELKTILNIQGDAVGTLNEQEVENKIFGGGSF